MFVKVASPPVFLHIISFCWVVIEKNYVCSFLSNEKDDIQIKYVLSYISEH